MLDLILALYRVEHEVGDAKLLGTAEHLKRRRAVSAPLLEQMRDRLQQHSTLHPPKSPLSGERHPVHPRPMGSARTLPRGRPSLPLDNNASESALQRRLSVEKNYLFVGNDEAGANVAGLYSLHVATCQGQPRQP